VPLRHRRTASHSANTGRSCADTAPRPRSGEAVVAAERGLPPCHSCDRVDQLVDRTAATANELRTSRSTCSTCSLWTPTAAIRRTSSAVVRRVGRRMAKASCSIAPPRTQGFPLHQRPVGPLSTS